VLLDVGVACLGVSTVRRFEVGLESFLAEDLERAHFKDWEMPATQFNGILLWYASTPFYLPFRKVKDYEDYLARLDQMPGRLDTAIAHMRALGSATI